MLGPTTTSTTRQGDGACWSIVQLNSRQQPKGWSSGPGLPGGLPPPPCPHATTPLRQATHGLLNLTPMHWAMGCPMLHSTKPQDSTAFHHTPSPTTAIAHRHQINPQTFQRGKPSWDSKCNCPMATSSIAPCTKGSHGMGEAKERKRRAALAVADIRWAGLALRLALTLCAGLAEGIELTVGLGLLDGPPAMAPARATCSHSPMALQPVWRTAQGPLNIAAPKPPLAPAYSVICLSSTTHGSAEIIKDIDRHDGVPLEKEVTGDAPSSLRQGCKSYNATSPGGEEGESQAPASMALGVASSP